MSEVDIRRLWQVVQQSRFAHQVERIPADMRRFDAGREALTNFRKYAEAGSLRSFGAAGKQPLQTDANAKKGNAVGDSIA